MTYNMMTHIQFLNNHIAYLEAMLNNVKTELMMIKNEVPVTSTKMAGTQTNMFPAHPPPPFPDHPPAPPSSPKNELIMERIIAMNKAAMPNTFQIQCEVPSNDKEILKKLEAPKDVNSMIRVLDGFEVFYLFQTAKFESAKNIWTLSADNFKKVYMDKAELINCNRKNTLALSVPKNMLSGYQMFTKIMLQYIDPEMKDNSKERFRAVAKLWNKLSDVKKAEWNEFSYKYAKKVNLVK